MPGKGKGSGQRGPISKYETPEAKKEARRVQKQEAQATYRVNHPNKDKDYKRDNRAKKNLSQAAQDAYFAYNGRPTEEADEQLARAGVPIEARAVGYAFWLNTKMYPDDWTEKQKRADERRVTDERTTTRELAEQDGYTFLLKMLHGKHPQDSTFCDLTAENRAEFISFFTVLGEDTRGVWPYYADIWAKYTELAGTQQQQQPGAAAGRQPTPQQAYVPSSSSTEKAASGDAAAMAAAALALPSRDNKGKGKATAAEAATEENFGSQQPLVPIARAGDDDHHHPGTPHSRHHQERRKSSAYGQAYGQRRMTLSFEPLGPNRLAEEAEADDDDQHRPGSSSHSRHHHQEKRKPSPVGQRRMTLSFEPLGANRLADEAEADDDGDDDDAGQHHHHPHRSHHHHHLTGRKRKGSDPPEHDPRNAPTPTPMPMPPTTSFTPINSSSSTGGGGGGPVVDLSTPTPPLGYMLDSKGGQGHGFYKDDRGGGYFYISKSGKKKECGFEFTDDKAKNKAGLVVDPNDPRARKLVPFYCRTVQGRPGFFLKIEKNGNGHKKEYNMYRLEGME